MTGITSLNNFEFEAGGTRVWRAYNIGPGKFFTSAELKKFGNPQGPTNLRILQPFSQPSRPVGALRLAQPGPSSGEEPAHPQEEQPTCESTEVSQFACPEEGCVKVYQSYNTLQRHLDVGKHLLKLERETTYDEIKRKWTATCKSVTGSYVRGEASTSTSNQSTSGAKLGPRIDAGWALKKSKKVTRFSGNVRQYLLAIFLQGEESGKKATPHDVATRMKTVSKEEGGKMFEKSEWLSESQIARYFSRLSALNKSGRLPRDASGTAVHTDSDAYESFTAEADQERIRMQIRRDLDL